MAAGRRFAFLVSMAGALGAAFALTTATALTAPAAAAAPATPTPAAPRQAFTVQDLVRLRRVSDVALSPDGRYAAYTLRTTDLDANRGRTGLWMIDLDHPDAAGVRLTDIAADASAAEWSADSRFVYFLSNRGGTDQVWRSTRDGAAEQITRLPLDVGSFRVSPRADRLLVSLEVFRDCADLACTAARLEAVARAPGHGRVYDQLFVRHWDTWRDGRRSQLFALTMDAAGRTEGTPVNLTADIDGDVPGKPFGGREDYAFSPDGRQVAFSVRAGTHGEPWSTNFDIYLVDAEGGTARDVTADNPAWDARPAFSPDGTQLAYAAMDRAGFEADRFHLVLLDLRSGARRALTPAWDRSVASFAWTPDGRTLLATADDVGQRPLWAIDAASGKPTALTGPGQVASFSVARRRVLYTLDTLAAPADVYELDLKSAHPSPGATPRALTHVNQDVLAARRLGDYEQFSFPGWHDEVVHGYVLKPPGFKEGAKYPVALVVHGGPQGSLANDWQWRWNAQTFAGAGYAVLMIDFHGSTGYGQAFTDSISGDWGGKPLEDLKLGVTAALAQYSWLDGDHMCALGASYGGYMMNWILGQWPDRFKCIVTHDGIFDHRTMYYSTEELWFPEWEHGGPEYQNPAGYTRDNPVDFVNRWQTPTLVIHGGLDYRVPDAQGLAVYTALQRRGVPSELLYFPDENHWVQKPANSIQWYDTVLAWMNRWTRP